MQSVSAQLHSRSGIANSSRNTALASHVPRGGARSGQRLVPVRSAKSDAAAAQTTEAASLEVQAGEELQCVGVGMEVVCEAAPQSHQQPQQADQEQQQEQPSASGRMPEDEDPLARLAGIALLISPFFFWGTSMVAMKQLGPHTTPLLLAAWRLLPAGAVLLAWAYRDKRPLLPSEPMGWLAVGLFGLVDGACFQGFLAEGLLRTSAGLGSVIIDSQPLSVALMAAVLFGEQLGAAGILGMLGGVLGLCLLEVPPDALPSALGSLLPSLSASGVDASTAAAATTAATVAIDTSAASTAVASSSGGWSIWDSGEWWMLLAAQSMAVGTVMVRWVSKYCDPVVATGWHMVLGGLPLVALALGQEGSELPARLADITGLDAALLLYVTLLGSAASYAVFFFNASRGNLTALSSLTFLTPMFAAAGGYLFLGETLTPLQLLGATVTLGAVALINRDHIEHELQKKRAKQQ